MELLDIGQSIGEKIAQAMKDTILEVMEPPNAASTVAKKGFDWPLIETGAMLEGITSESEQVGLNVVQVESGLFDSDLVKKAAVNEWHPDHPRPFGTITADVKVPGILEDADDDLEGYFVEIFMR